MLNALTANREADICLASTLMHGWQYIDFWNPRTNTPVLALEYLFGSRGVLIGRLMKLEAMYGVGKSSFMYYVYGCAQQSMNAWCYHAETEAAPAPTDFIASFGVRPEDLMIQQPKSVEALLEQIDKIICTIRGGFGGEMGETGRMKKTTYTSPLDKDKESPIVMGVDSVSALGLDDLVDIDVTDATKRGEIAKHARLLSGFLQNRILRFKETQTLIMLAAQLKSNIQVTHMAGQKAETTIADKPIGYHATYILHMTGVKYVDQATGSNVGDKITLKTTKNKVSDKDHEVTMYLIRNHGFDLTHTDMDFMVSHPASPFADGEVKRYNGGVICKPLSDKKFTSEDEFLQALYANTDYLMSLREKLRVRGFRFAFEAAYVPPEDVEEQPANVMETNQSGVLGA